MPELCIGVDLSERIVRVVLVDGTGAVQSRREFDPGGTAVAGALHDAVRELAGGAREAAVVVAVPLPGEDLSADVTRALAEAIRGLELRPVITAGAALAVAHQSAGAADGARSLIGLAVGRHVSAGLLIGEEPWAGAHGLAGSIGWLALNPVEREDYRRFGGLEAEVSAAGIVRRFIWRVKSGDDSAVAGPVRSDFSLITVDDIFRGAREGDGVCISVVRDTARYLGMAIANMVSVLDPDVVVLGGALAVFSDLVLDPIRIECGRRVRPAQAERLRIDLASLDGDTVAMGAARMASRPGP